VLPRTDLLILDELQIMGMWKNFLRTKGKDDVEKSTARLDGYDGRKTLYLGSDGGIRAMAQSRTRHLRVVPAHVGTLCVHAAAPVFVEIEAVAPVFLLKDKGSGFEVVPFDDLLLFQTLDQVFQAVFHFPFVGEAQAYQVRGPGFHDQGAASRHAGVAHAFFIPGPGARFVDVGLPHETRFLYLNHCTSPRE
jgi:hypothetical protein